MNYPSIVFTKRRGHFCEVWFATRHHVLQKGVQELLSGAWTPLQGSGQRERVLDVKTTSKMLAAFLLPSSL